MQDLYGRPAWERRTVLTDLISRTARWGYELLELNPLEYEQSFSENVVGLSPWPEWNPNNCFRLPIIDFDAAYSPLAEHQMVLIPEGTVSVARWLAGQISSGALKIEQKPFKIMYECPCFRNEAVPALSSRKLRKFDQFGCEIIGASTAHADTETIFLACELLSSFGLLKQRARARVGNVELFNTLSARTDLNPEEAVRAKELLDLIAERRAARLDTSEQVQEILQLVAERAGSNESLLDAWRWLATAEIQFNGKNFDIPHIPWELSKNSVAKVASICQDLRQLGIDAVVDLAVVRSHEYYTGIVFEIDYVAGNDIGVEIAGGGRYDRLIDPFLDQGIGALNSTGFAFGIQRLLDFASRIGANLPQRANFVPPLSCEIVARTDDAVLDLGGIAALQDANPAGAYELYLGDDVRNYQDYDAERRSRQRDSTAEPTSTLV
jgi:histidyl-tRNA synthetase